MTDTRALHLLEVPMVGLEPISVSRVNNLLGELYTWHTHPVHLPRGYFSLGVSPTSAPPAS